MIEVAGDLQGYDRTLVGLEDRAFGVPRRTVRGGNTVLDLRRFNGDQLVIAVRQAGD